MLNLLLSKKGIRCDLAEDGVECIEIMNGKGMPYYNLLFLDNLMPKKVIIIKNIFFFF